MKAHEQELAATREAIDQAYRKEWKAKNREMERIREEAAASVAEMQKRLDRELERGREECATKVAALEEQIQSLSITHGESLARVQQDAASQVATLHATIERARNAIEESVMFSIPSFPFSSCLGGRRPLPPSETCLLTPESS